MNYPIVMYTLVHSEYILRQVVYSQDILSFSYLFSLPSQPSHTPPLTIPSPLAPRQKQRVMLQRLETPSEEQEEINKMAAEEVQGDLSTEVFSPYTAQHPVFACAKPHPADIVEAASLAVSV